jgi:hypothetical protein
VTGSQEYSLLLALVEAADRPDCTPEQLVTLIDWCCCSYARRAPAARTHFTVDRKNTGHHAPVVQQETDLSAQRVSYVARITISQKGPNTSGYRAVPAFVRDQVVACGTDTFYVGRRREYSRAEVADGRLGHLGIGWDLSGLSVPGRPVVPPATRGRWSKYNVDGRVLVRRDLPKIDKVIGGWETPNFGDWSRGSHTNYIARQVFQRETLYGQGLAIRVEADEPVDDKVVIGFIVDRVFDRRDLSDRDLLMACSLLRENIGSAPAILATDVSVAQWLRQQRVSWEILPVGEAGPRPFTDIARRLNADLDSPRVKRMGERYDRVAAMGRAEIIVGEGEFTRYFGFKFRDNLVALECLDYGNALYLMYEDWMALSQRTRVDLLADTSARYDRVVHRSGWEGRLAALLRVNGYTPQLSAGV